MGRSRPWTAVALPLALSAGCSGGDGTVPQVPRGVPAEIARLVPEDAFGFVLFAPARTLEEKWNDLEDAMGRKESPLYGLLERFEEHAPAGARIDRGKALGIALSFDDEDDLEATYLVPDGDGYVGVRDGNRLDPPASPSPLASSILDADAAMRIDVEALVERFQEEIDAVTSGGRFEGLPFPPGGPDPGQVLGPALEVLRDLIDAAQTLDLALVLDGTEIDFVAALVARPGSALDVVRPATGSVLEIAKLLPRRFPIEAAMNFDPSAIARLTSSFQDLWLAGLPEEDRDASRSWVKTSMEIQDLLTGAAAVGLDFAEPGFAAVVVQAARDAETYVDGTWNLLLQGNPLFETEVLPEREVEGVRVRNLRMKLDEEAFSDLGGHSPTFARNPFFASVTYGLAAVDGKAILVWGGDEDLVAIAVGSAQRGGGRVPEGLARAADKAGPGAAALARVDLRATLKGFAAMMGPMGEMILRGMEEDGPVDLLLWFGNEGRVYRGGLSFDVEELRSLRPSKRR